MLMSGLDVKVPGEFAAGSCILSNGRAVRLCNSAHYYPNCKAPVHLPKRPQRVLGHYARSSVACVSLYSSRWSCCRLPDPPRFADVPLRTHKIGDVVGERMRIFFDLAPIMTELRTHDRAHGRSHRAR
jgi:hypothetical protein